jgi:hypothetical protein
VIECDRVDALPFRIGSKHVDHTTGFEIPSAEIALVAITQVPDMSEAQSNSMNTTKTKDSEISYPAAMTTSASVGEAAMS